MSISRQNIRPLMIQKSHSALLAELAQFSTVLTRHHRSWLWLQCSIAEKCWRRTSTIMMRRKGPAPNKFQTNLMDLLLVCSRRWRAANWKCQLPSTKLPLVVLFNFMSSQNIFALNSKTGPFILNTKTEHFFVLEKFVVAVINNVI